MRSPKVWIVNDGGHDYSKARQFGELDVLTEGDVPVFKLERVWKNLCLKILEAQPDDYVLISGTPILTGLVLHLWFLTFGECNILQFDAKSRRYQPDTLDPVTLAETLERTLGGRRAEAGSSEAAGG